MQFTLLTYNTLLNDAQKELRDIFALHKPDIVCLQEVDTSPENIESIEKLGYLLADYSNGFIKFGKVFGVATFYKKTRFTFFSSKSITLPRGIGEAIAFILRVFKTQKKDRTVLKTVFKTIEGDPLVVYNIHLSAHGTNGIRIKQLEKTLRDIDIDTKKPTILVGDFNYPYGRKKLEELMQVNGFAEATAAIPFTSDGKLIHYAFLEKILMRIIQLIFGKLYKLDYCFFKNCNVITASKINAYYSDHFPIIARFEIQNKQKNDQ